MNVIPASVHAQAGTILISDVSRVGVSVLTCIKFPAFLSPLPRFFSVVCHVSVRQMSPLASNSKLTTSAGATKKNMKPACQTSVGYAHPLPHPGKEPPQERNGQRCRKTYAEASHPHHPHSFPRLAKPGGVEAHSHLRGPHQAGISGQRLANAKREPPCQRLPHNHGRLRTLPDGSQPELLRLRQIHRQPRAISPRASSCMFRVMPVLPSTATSAYSIRDTAATSPCPPALRSRWRSPPKPIPPESATPRSRDTPPECRPVPH